MPPVIEDPQNVRSRRTRAQLLATMRTLLEKQGFEALTVSAVAERAGVSRRTVYLHFASRRDMVTQLFDYIAEEEGLTRSQQPIWDAPDAVTALHEWVRHFARYHPNVLAIDRAVQQMRRIDPDAASHYRVVVESQRAAARTLATRLHDEGRLASPWTVSSAGDLIWALASSEIIERLVVERRWSRRKLANHLTLVLRSTLVDEAATG